MKKNVYITGYQSFELGIFSDKDEKVKGLRYFLRKRLLECLDEGYEWFMFSGKLGVEYYAFEEALSLKEEYPELSIALILPFEDYGTSWNESNQQKLSFVKSHADFVGYVSKGSYESVQQLKLHTNFLLNHTQLSIVIYDDEVNGKVKYFVKDVLDYSKVHHYQLRLYSLYDLQEAIYELYAKENESQNYNNFY